MTQLYLFDPASEEHRESAMWFINGIPWRIGDTWARGGGDMAYHVRAGSMEELHQKIARVTGQIIRFRRSR